MVESTTNNNGIMQNDVIQSTLAYISAHHSKTYLKSGECLFNHALETVHILQALHVDNDVLQASMLVPLAEILLETKTEKNLLVAEFGLLIEKQLATIVSAQVVSLIKVVCRLIHIGHCSTQSLNISGKSDQEKLLSTTDLTRKAQVEALKGLFLALAGNVNVILILLALRLQTLRYYARQKISAPRLMAVETLEVYAPLANRLGIGQIKWELEDLAFRFYDQEAYHHIAKMLDEKRSERQQYVAAVIIRLKNVLQNAGITAEISGRPKHIYSIWRKMYGKHLTFSELYDMLALRVIVLEIQDCYMVLGLIHNLWQSIPKEFDDYISRPKTNGYQSLHTVVVGENSRAFEIQIRTAAMHQFAEYGVAAHWRYKENAYAGEYSSNQFAYQNIETQLDNTKIDQVKKDIVKKDGVDKKINQANIEKTKSDSFAIEKISQTIKANKKNKNSAIFDSNAIVFNQENAKKELAELHGKSSLYLFEKPSPDDVNWLNLCVDTHLIYVLTPQAKIVTLPRGATPIDFAYHLHTDLGHRCRGARVDGVIVSLNTPLQNGQIVEIIAFKQGGPSRDWLNSQLGYIQSQRARQKVRAWFNAIDTNNTIATGRTIVEKILQREGKTALSFDELAAKLSFSHASALFLAVAKEEISHRLLEQTISQIDHANKLNLIEAPTSFTISYKPNKNSNRKLAGNQVLVAGVDSLQTQFARCCCPAPPDKIVGYLTKTKGVSVHRAQCQNFAKLAEISPERAIDVDWLSVFQNAQNSALYPVKLHVIAVDRPLLMRDIVEIFSREKIRIVSIQSQSKKDLIMMNLTVEVSAIQVIHRTLVWLNEISGVRQASRIGDNSQ